MPSSSSASPPSPLAVPRPFEVIVVVSPDAEAARAVHESNAAPPAVPAATEAGRAAILPNGVLMISTSDPYGCEMGSGGGTLAALAEADEVYHRWKAMSRSYETEPPNVLICHAKSREFPVHLSVGALQTGMAWKDLQVMFRDESPFANGSGSDDDCTACAIFTDQPTYSLVTSNPVAMLLHSLSIVFRDVPRGSVVVVTDSDIILSFNDSYRPNYREEIDFDDDDKMKIDFDELQDNNSSAVGLAVPFPARSNANSTAPHAHQVVNPFILHDKRWRILPSSRPLQGMGHINSEETVDPLEGAFYMADQPLLYIAQGSGREMTWVDAGVVAFLPSAADSLRELSLSTLRCCTLRGLKNMYEQEYGEEESEDNEAPSLEEFARENSREICLHGDILWAFGTSSIGSARSSNHDDALSALRASSSGQVGTGNLSEGGLRESLFEKLSRHRLYTCTVPTGSLVRLGTAGQLADYLTAGISISMGPSLPTQVSRFNHHLMGQPITRYNSLVMGSPFNRPNIGRGSVLEHCHITFAERMAVGERCLVSGLRGPVRGHSLRVPSEMLLQLLPLRRTYRTDSQSFVCICLGVEDVTTNVPPVTLFGMDLRRILQRSSLTEDDLWDASMPSSGRTLQNARIHPVLSTNTDEEGGLDFSFLDLIGCLRESSTSLDGVLTEAAILGWRQWVGARRLCLSEVQLSVDFEAEAMYRRSIPLWDHFPRF